MFPRMNDESPCLNPTVAGMVAGGGVLLVFLVFVPEHLFALNYFDPPKRVVWSVLAVFLASFWERPSSRAGRRQACILFALMGWMLLRSFFRPVPFAGMEVLVGWLLPPLFFLLGAGVKLSMKGRRIFGSLLLLAGGSQAVLMLLQRFGLDPLFPSITWGMSYAPSRMIGTVGFQNQAVDAVALSCAGVLLISPSMKWLLLWAGVAFPVVVLSGNRGGILGFLSAMVITVVLYGLGVFSPPDGKKRLGGTALALSAAFSVFVLAIALVPETRERFMEIFRGFHAGPAIQSRLYMARIGLEMFFEKPWAGWGAGEYALQYLARLGALLPDEKTHVILRNVVYAREAHNDLLQFAVEFGLPGLVLLFAGLCHAALGLAREKDGDRAAISGTVCVFAYMSVASFFSFSWQSAVAGPLAGLLLGVLWTHRMMEHVAPPPPPSQKKPGFVRRLPKAALLVVSTGVLVFHGRNLFLNTVVPTWVADGDTAGVENFLSNRDYTHLAFLGAAFAADGRYGEALRLLELAREGHSDLALLNNLGNAFSNTGQWFAARRVYAEWAATGLDHANALQNLSVAYENTGKYAEAAESLSRRMSLWPDSATVKDVNRLGVLHLYAGSPSAAEAALRTYQEVWTQSEGHERAQMENLSGAVALSLGQTGKAEAKFREALRHDPGLESARRNLRSLSDR